MTNRRVAFVNDYRAVMCFTSSVAVSAFVITAAIITVPITITSVVIVSRIIAITVDPGAVTTVARGCIGGAPVE
jgi:hypothetical protein